MKIFLSFLQKLTALQELYLYNTRVLGNIENLRNLTGLKYLALSSTGALGYIDALVHLLFLEVAKLRGTAVSGWISSAWNGQCQKLRELDLGARG